MRRLACDVTSNENSNRLQDPVSPSPAPQPTANSSHPVHAHITHTHHIQGVRLTGPRRCGTRPIWLALTCDQSKSPLSLRVVEARSMRLHPIPSPCTRTHARTAYTCNEQAVRQTSAPVAAHGTVRRSHPSDEHASRLCHTHVRRRAIPSAPCTHTHRARCP